MANTASSDESRPWLCITQGRCRLCQFCLVDNERVIAKVGQNAISREFPFRRGSRFHDDLSDVQIHMCCRWQCDYGDSVTFCMHPACYSFRLSPISAEFLISTVHSSSFSPSMEAEDRRRRHYLQRGLAARLPQACAWPRELKLPLELWTMIAGFLVRECAVVSLQEQVLQSQNQQRRLGLDLAKPVYASYVSVEGRCYLQCLRNMDTPDPEANSAETKRMSLLFPGCSVFTQSRVALLVAADHLGIRRVVFIPEGQKLAEWCRRQVHVPGLWWKHFRADVLAASDSDGGPALIVEHDVLKVRDIRAASSEPFENRINWPLPLPSPPEVIDLVSPNQRPDPMPFQMRSVNLNFPGTIGYSVAFNMISVVSIVSHRRNEVATASLYKDANPGCLWIYMPISEGEYVTDVSRRITYIIQRPRIGLVLSTNRGQTKVFTDYGRHYLHTHRLAALTGAPCRMYFNQADTQRGVRNVRVVAFDDAAADGNTASHGDSYNPPYLPMPASPCPATGSTEYWHYSSCSLENAVAIQTCMDMKVTETKTKQHRPIIGMLVSYADGHQECVGQWRFDWASKLMITSGTDGLHLCHQITRLGSIWRHRFIGAVALHTALRQTPQTPQTFQTSPFADSQWVAVDWTGTLEWWFSHRQNWLYHNGVRL